MYDESHIGNEVYSTDYECPNCHQAQTDYDGYCVCCGEWVVDYGQDAGESAPEQTHVHIQVPLRDGPGIEVISVKCPECGAALQFDAGQEEGTCEFCGSRILLHNANEYIFRHVDEARVQEAISDQEVRMKRLDFAEKVWSENAWNRSFLMKVWLGAGAAVIVFWLVVWVAAGAGAGFSFLFASGLLVFGGGGYVLLCYLPEKEREEQLIAEGWIRFPQGLEPLETKRFEEIGEALWNAGFRRVDCVSLHDMTTYRVVDLDGKVDSILVSGASPVPGKLYSPDVPVTVSYHGR